jgi:hypothetical protein
MREIEELKLRLELAEPTLQGVERHVKDRGGVDLAPLVLFRHIWRMADAILILAEKGATYSTFPLLRSMFEGYLSLKYILQDSSDPDIGFSKKSLAWQAFAIYQIVKDAELIKPDTNQGKDFLNCLKKRDNSIAKHCIEYLRGKTDDHDSGKDVREWLKQPDLYEFYLKLECDKPQYFFRLFHPGMSVAGLS